MEPRFCPKHVTPPAAHGYHCEFAIFTNVFGRLHTARRVLGDPSELGDSKAVNVGHLECANVATPFTIERGAVHFEAAEWVRPIEYDYFDAIFKSGLHRITHATNICVRADADILKVDY